MGQGELAADRAGVSPERSGCTGDDDQDVGIQDADAVDHRLVTAEEVTVRDCDPSVQRARG
jgi:hypothetical protein